jgi:hypothetical protein
MYSGLRFIMMAAAVANKIHIENAMLLMGEPSFLV